jgi:DNA repair protein RecO (recombination protein O)
VTTASKSRKSSAVPLSPQLPAGPLAAFVLHQYPWSESSLIVELFTRERGRVVVAAKGAKRPYSQLRPVLMPFQRLTVQLGKTPADKRNEVHVLRTAEWAGGVPCVAGSAYFAGFYLNELLIKLLPREDPHAALFDVYAQTLLALSADDEAQTQAALRAFELRLLRELGWLPELRVVTLTAEPVQAQAQYHLDAEAGVLATTEAALPGALLVALEAALYNGSLPMLRETAALAKTPLRAALRGLLQYHLGHAPLRTRAVLHSVQLLHQP